MINKPSDILFVFLVIIVYYIIKNALDKNRKDRKILTLKDVGQSLIVTLIISVVFLFINIF